jgi:hypothetical protein
MTARDRFSAPLECPKCGRSGKVQFSELDGYSYMSDRSTTVDDLPEGFKVVQKPSGWGTVDIFCEQCDVSALKARAGG